jgi:hypothetical protein
MDRVNLMVKYAYKLGQSPQPILLPRLGQLRPRPPKRVLASRALAKLPLQMVQWLQGLINTGIDQKLGRKDDDMELQSELL